MRARIQQEFALLQQHYSGVEHKEHAGEDWFKLARYPFPTGWQIGETSIETASIIFKIGAAYPGGEPYAFLAPMGLNFKGSPPINTTAAPAAPFEGLWLQFSWAPDGWSPADDVNKGSNLLIWARSFMHRLKEGA
jgi:hypothetical protein